MTLRIVEQEELDQVEQLWDYSFEKYEDPFFQWYFNHYCGQQNTVVGGFNEQGRLQTMVHVNPYALQLRGRLWEIPYLVGVATAPEARGQHLVRPLLAYTCQLLRQQKLAFAFLMPIQAGIYLPYEFSYCYFRHGYTWSLEQLRLPKVGQELVVTQRPVDVEMAEVEHLMALYLDLTSTWNGVPFRDGAQWRKLMTTQAAEGMRVALVYEEGEATGYMLYKLEQGVFNVHELLAADFPSRNRLLLFAAQHKSEAKEIHWLAEAWDRTYLHLPRQEQSGYLQPFMMARCLNPWQALRAYVPPEPLLGSLVLELTDSLLPENNGRVALNVVMDHVELVPTEEQVDVRMDMGALTQIYFGAYTATELAEAGKITVHNAAQLAVLDKLFPKCRNFINEYF